MRKEPSLLFIVMAMLAVSCGFNSHRTSKSYNLFPLPCQSSDNGLVYYVDEEGNLMEGLTKTVQLLNCKTPHFFSDELLMIKTYSPNSFYFLNKNGDIVLNSGMFDSYDSTFDSSKTRWRSHAFPYASDFSEGIAFIWQYDEHGPSYAIDKSGKVLFELNGRPTSAFYNGYAFVRDLSGNGGIIDNKGNYVARIDDYPYNFDPPVRGCYIVKNKHHLKYGSDYRSISAINIKGDTLFKDFIAVSGQNLDCNERIVFMNEDELYGLVNSKGEVVIEPKYKELVNDGEWYFYREPESFKSGWVDKNGKIMLAHDLDYIRETLWYLFNGSEYFLDYENSSEDDTKCSTTLYDRKGNVAAIVPYYKIMTPFVNGIAIGYNYIEKNCAILSLQRILKGLPPEINNNRFLYSGIFQYFQYYAFDSALYLYGSWQREDLGWSW